MNFDPKLDNTLSNCARSLKKITVFKWFIFNSKPALTVEPVIQIDLCNTNQIIAEEGIIIVSLNAKGW
jgi:hypothetical protein